MNKTSVIGQLNRLDTYRLKAYRELLDFYHGRQWEGRERRGEKRLTFNYTKVFIDKITSYLMSGISFVVEAAEMALGRKLAVIFFDEHNAKDAVVVGVYS